MNIAMTLEEIEAKVPARTVGALKRYLNDRVSTGGFLRAVLENKLFEAYNRADSENAEALPYIVSYIFNVFPVGAYGSPEKVEEYLKERR